MPLESEGFKGLSLNAKIVKEVEAFIRKNQNYKSAAEFVNEAIRIRLEQLTKLEA